MNIVWAKKKRKNLVYVLANQVPTRNEKNMSLVMKELSILAKSIELRKNNV